MYDKPTRMFCQICGRLHKIDFWVPDEIWDAAINPRYKDTHICINCFMERADEILIPWDREIKLWPCSMATQIEIQRQAAVEDASKRIVLTRKIKDDKFSKPY